MRGALALILLAGSAQAQPVGLANPAAEFCTATGSTFEIREDEAGAKTGYCLLRDGREIDAWSYMREATHAIPGLPNPAAEYCAASGGRYASHTDADGSAYGTCTRGGKKQDAWQVFRAAHEE